MKAGKRTSEEIKLFLDASYQNKPPENIGDWILDKTISNKTGKVYYNPKTHEAVVAHRGTKDARDWINNVAYVTGTYKNTTRYKRGKNLQNKAEAKYGKENISTLGHSQGAILARDLGEDTKEIINVNPAYLGEKNAVNEYNIKSSSDIVSGFYPEKDKDIVIPSKDPFDIVGEHSYNILDRLDENQWIGKGLDNLKSPHYNIMTFGGKRCQELGYSVDDIDWINGGVRGGPRDVAKKMRRGMKPVSKTLSKANPLGYKEVQNVGAKMGDVTNNYLLPAVVSAGKPMLDVAAMGASTALTGNPFLGKTVSDIAWREGVEKTGNDPRERQKSKELGELSEVAGKTGSKFIGFGRKKKAGARTNKEEEEARKMEREDRPHLPHAERIQDAYGALPEISASEVRQATDFEDEANAWDDEMESINIRYYNEEISLARALQEANTLSDSLARNREVFVPEDYNNLMRNSRRQIRAFDLMLSSERELERRREQEGSVGCVASGRKKGGASLQQIGQAAAMRSFTRKNNPAYSLLSQVVHSADNPKNNPKLSPFQDLALTPNPDVQRILDAMTPSYLRSLHFSIDKGIKDGSLDPAYYLDILDRIEKRDPNAVRNVRNYNDKWGGQDEEVRRMLATV